MNSENSLLESTLGFMITDYDVLERGGGGGQKRNKIYRMYGKYILEHILG